MVSIDKINREIEELENGSSTSYTVIEKLAMLYIVRDNLTKNRNSNMIGYRMNGKSDSDGEVARITQQMRPSEIEDEYREHMAYMREKHPEEYDREMEHMRRKYDRSR